MADYCRDPACTRYGKIMTPSGLPGRDNKTRNWPTCFGKPIRKGARWPVVKHLIKRSQAYMDKILNGSDRVSHVDKMADLLEQAQRAARELSEDG